MVKRAEEGRGGTIETDTDKLATDKGIGNNFMHAEMETHGHRCLLQTRHRHLMMSSTQFENGKSDTIIPMLQNLHWFPLAIISNTSSHYYSALCSQL